MVMQPMLPQAMQIVEIRAENEQTKTFVLDGALEAMPGQFVICLLYTSPSPRD